MGPTETSPKYIALAIDSEDARRPLFARQRRPRNFRPAAIRFPSLILFASILALCVVLIEIIFRQSSDSSSTDSNNATSAKRDVLMRRESATQVACQDWPAITSEIYSLDQVGASLCSASALSYTTGTRLNSAQSSAFTQWLTSYSAMDSSWSKAMSDQILASTACVKSNMTPAAGFLTTSPTAVTIHMGCRTTTMDIGCFGGVSIFMTNSSVAMSASEVCATSATAMLTLGSSVRTTSYAEASTATAYLTLTTSDYLTLTSKSTILSLATPTSALLTLTSAASALLTLTSGTIAGATPPSALLTLSSAASTLLTLTSPMPTVETKPVLSTVTSLPTVSEPYTTTFVSSVQTETTIVGQTTNLLDLTSPSQTEQWTPTATLITLYSSTVVSTASDGRASDTSFLALIMSTSSSEIATVPVPYRSTSTSITDLLDSNLPLTILPSPDSSVAQSTIASEQMISATDSPTTSSTSQTMYTMTTQYTTMIGTTDQAGQSTSISVVMVAETLVTTSPVPSTAVSPATAVTGNDSTTVPQIPVNTLKANEAVVHRTFTHFSYFSALYLAPILAVIIKSFWEVVYSCFKMLEPFQRLSEPGGVSAKRGLFAQYLSNLNSLDAVKSCFNGRLLPLITTLIYLLVTGLATLAASSMTVRAGGTCEISPGITRPCDPLWIVDSRVLRYVEILLVVCIMFTFLVAILSYRQKSGVASNPSSIASIASILNHDSLIRDLRQINPLADESTMTAALHDRQCRLEYHESADGNQQYGITRKLVVASPPGSSKRRSLQSQVKRWLGGYSALSNPATDNDVGSSSFFSLRTQSVFLDTVQLASTAALFSLVTAYRFDGKSDPLNNFFNSGSFWARFVYVAIASLVDIQWKRLEREVRITEPYRRMAKGFARPETTVLMTLNGTCWSELPGSLCRFLRYRDMWFQTLMSFVAAISDFNIIAVASVAYSDAQTPQMLDVGSFLAMSITGLMMLVMLLTMLWWRRGVVTEMPRCPDTIGAIFSYLCASKMTQVLGSAQLEDVGHEERDEMLLAAGWRFRFGKKINLDGVERWCVDFESTSPSYQEEPDVVKYG